jgi:phosphatidylserine/phosphatidylglycerophosphate/cardiolipin synthase-like enzyme
MKKRVSILFIACVSCFLIYSTLHAEEITLDHTRVKIFYSPDGGCTNAIVKEINNARSEILVQAYSFTSKDIASALTDAFKRHIKIQVILDKSQRTEKYSSASFVANAGIPTYIDAKHSIAHNKIMIIDKSIVITGSFNFTRAAEERNAENLIILPSKELAVKYIGNWEKHKEHSEIYKPRSYTAKAG